MAQRQFKGSKTAIAVAAAGTTTLDTIYPYEGMETLWLEVSNINKPLDGFTIEVRPHAGASFHTLYNDASDFTTNIQWPVLGCNVDFTSLDSDSVGLLSMNIRALDALRFKASSASPSTVTALRWEVR